MGKSLTGGPLRSKAYNAVLYLSHSFDWLRTGEATDCAKASYYVETSKDAVEGQAGLRPGLGNLQLHLLHTSYKASSPAQRDLLYLLLKTYSVLPIVALAKLGVSTSAFSVVKPHVAV